jgi:hypothetical protein
MGHLPEGTKAGVRAAEAFFPKRLVCNFPDPEALATARRQLYRRPAVRRRLLPVLANLPVGFFDRLVFDRELHILASASASGPWVGTPGEIDVGAHDSYASCGPYLQDADTFALNLPLGSWLIRLGRIAIELAPPQAFAGIVIHECCHVDRGHKIDAGTGAASTQRREDDVVGLACQLGFREETAAYLDFYRETFGDAGIMGRLPADCASAGPDS